VNATATTTSRLVKSTSTVDVSRHRPRALRPASVRAARG
jgi:hypothetical protein